MFEQFTDRARHALELATEEARRLNHEYIGTEHILLGLMSEGRGVAANVLKHLDLDLPKLRSEVAKIARPGAETVATDRLPQTPRAKKVIQSAIDEEGRLHQGYVGTEHLLLGLVREQDGVASQVLLNLGLTPESVADAVFGLLGSGPTIETEAPAIEDVDSLERFSDRAREVMALANQEAIRFNHEYVGTEHILLAIAKGGSGIATKALQRLGVDLPKVRLEVERLIERGPDTVTMGRLPQTPRAKKALECAREESRSLEHKYVGTGHLLLGLFREQDGIAAQVLMNLGLKVEGVREAVVEFQGAVD